jgi:hypothetical protein
LKKLLLIVICIAAWQFYQQHIASGPVATQGRVFDSSYKPDPVVDNPINPVAEIRASAPVSSEQFRCDGRVYCTQMRSMAEAEFFIRNCPGTKMDGNHDGEPCENDSRF